MSKGLFDLILDEIFDSDWTGRRGKKLTARELKFVRLLGREGKILRNLYVPMFNGQTTEIDLLYITRKGIFVLESKNYSGWVFGDEKGKNWTVMLPNREKYRLYNPILQNRTHVKWLGKYIGRDIPLFSIIVFSERCELKKIPENTATVRIIKRDWTYATIRDIWNNSPDALTDDEVEELFEQLQKLTDADVATKEAHIENIKNKTRKSPEPEKTENGELICPKCGRKLVLRTAKKGAYVGNQFYGCSGFPQCRYIKNVEKGNGG